MIQKKQCQLMSIAIKAASVVVISLILPISCFGDEAEKPKPVVKKSESFPDDKSRKTKEKFKWIILGAPSYSSDSGLGMGALFAAGNPKTKYFTFEGSYSGKEKQGYELRYSQQGVFSRCAKPSRESGKDGLAIGPEFSKGETKFFDPIGNIRHDAIGSFQYENTILNLTWWQRKGATAWVYGMSYGFFYLHFFDFDVLPDANLSLKAVEMVDKLRRETVDSHGSSISPFISNDTRDDQVNPSKGRLYNFYLTLARMESLFLLTVVEHGIKEIICFP